MMTTKKKINKVVLAYSGGLDTSIIVHWLIENYGCEVICFTANIGQDDELEGLEEKAIKSGASKIFIEDLSDEFLREYVFPTIQAGAIYERKYLLGTSFARPLIAKRLVEIAEAEGADGIAHGCTGKGNDQVRFEVSAMALNPALTIIAPWREWDIRSREDAIAYAEKHHIALKQTKTTIYSRDRNIWHMSHEGGMLEDPWLSPDDDVFTLTQSAENAPAEAEEIILEFKSGVPVGLNGEMLDPVPLMQALNEIGGKHGVGRIDLVENRLVGMKSHGIYETPGGTILYKAHQELEGICLDKDTLHYKEMIALRYAELVYDGKWFSSLREALDGFVMVTQKNITGHVRLKLYRGNIIVLGRKSPYSLYREDYASFGQMDIYDQQDAKGFINLWGLPMKVDALLNIAGNGTSRFRAPDYSIFKRD
ncbi:MAG: argininosuccinate synthase [Anaerolineaceae bacterium]|nr:argininosuccinate synthase [Anaerolineaceae bacterium]